MRIKTTIQINARTHDGREFTAEADSVEEIADDDAGMVGLARGLIMSGQAVHYGDAGAVEDASSAEPTGDEVVDGGDELEPGDDPAEEDD